jgi:hypothetical protein
MGKQYQYFSQKSDNDEEITKFGKDFSEYIHKKLKIKIDPSVFYVNFSREELFKVLLFTNKRMKIKNYEILKKPNKRQLFMRFLYSTPSDLYYYFLEKKTTFYA